MKINLKNMEIRFSKTQKNRRGAMLVLIAIMMIILMIALAFSVDVAYMQLSRTELRASTDAAARAGAEALSRLQSESGARAAAVNLASQNKVAGQPLSLANSDITIGHTEVNSSGTWIFSTTGTPFNAVKVNGARTSTSNSGSIPLFFGGMFGIYDYEPTQVAIGSQLDRDIAIVVDRSGSMDDYNRWEGLSDAMDVFLADEIFVPPLSRIW